MIFLMIRCLNRDGWCYYDKTNSFDADYDFTVDRCFCDYSHRFYVEKEKRKNVIRARLFD